MPNTPEKGVFPWRALISALSRQRKKYADTFHSALGITALAQPVWYHVRKSVKNRAKGQLMKRKQPIVFWFLIHDVSRLRRTAFDKRMRPLGITRSQWSVLARIARHGTEGITQTELAGILDLGKVALGGLVDRLEASGFVERRADANDRRINRVFLTRKGHTGLDGMVKVAVAMNAKVMLGIPADHQSLLAEILQKMKTNLLALEEAEASTKPLSSRRRAQR